MSTLNEEQIKLIRESILTTVFNKFHEFRIMIEKLPLHPQSQCRADAMPFLRAAIVLIKEAINHDPIYLADAEKKPEEAAAPVAEVTENAEEKTPESIEEKTEVQPDAA